MKVQMVLLALMNAASPILSGWWAGHIVAKVKLTQQQSRLLSPRRRKSASHASKRVPSIQG